MQVQVKVKVFFIMLFSRKRVSNWCHPTDSLKLARKVKKSSKSKLNSLWQTKSLLLEKNPRLAYCHVIVSVLQLCIIIRTYICRARYICVVMGWLETMRTHHSTLKEKLRIRILTLLLYQSERPKMLAEKVYFIVKPLKTESNTTVSKPLEYGWNYIFSHFRCM